MHNVQCKPLEDLNSNFGPRMFGAEPIGPGPKKLRNLSSDQTMEFVKYHTTPVITA